jgi:hypothetical protein
MKLDKTLCRSGQQEAVSLVVVIRRHWYGKLVHQQL